MDKSSLKEVFEFEESSTPVVPVDIVTVVLWVLGADIVLVTLDGGVLRAGIGLGTLLFVPGYLLTAIVFPRRHQIDRAESRVGDDSIRSNWARLTHRQSITWRERLALSFGLSLAVIPLLALVIAQVMGSLSPDIVLLGFNLFVLVSGSVAVYRRYGLATTDRLRFPVTRLSLAVREHVQTEGSQFDRLVAAFLVLVVVASAGTFGYVLLAPQTGEAYTSATLVAEDGNGDLVASGYPTNLTQGEQTELNLRVDNREREETNYTVVAELQRLGPNNESVLEKEEALRTSKTVEDGKTWVANHTITPGITGEEVRLTYYVYRGGAPPDPDGEQAYRTVYLWVSISESGT